MTEPVACVATLVVADGQQVADAQRDGLRNWLIGQGGRIAAQRWSADRRAVDLVFDAAALPDARPQIAGADLFIQAHATRLKRVLVADMESTIIEQEMLDELAAATGLGPQVAAITRRAMDGQIDFAGALAERLRLLAGTSQAMLDRVAGGMTLSPGAAALVSGMQAAGARCWLVSGGFDVFVSRIAERLGFDGFYANLLVMQGDAVAGTVAPPLLDAAAKREHLERICAGQGVTVRESLAVGDGANDVPMQLASAAAGGLGVAYRAKPSVRAQLRDRIDHSDLSALLYAQGLGVWKCE